MAATAGKSVFSFFPAPLAPNLGPGPSPQVDRDPLVKACSMNDSTSKRKCEKNVSPQLLLRRWRSIPSSGIVLPANGQ